jgi:hypothetical protein
MSGVLQRSGRKKGIPNKVTANLRDAIMHAFDKVGGENYLVGLARTRPDLFCMLLARILPLQVTGKDGAALQIDVTVRERIASRIALLADRRAERENPGDVLQ